jgi:hypothetical protein
MTKRHQAFYTMDSQIVDMAFCSDADACDMVKVLSANYGEELGVDGSLTLADMIASAKSGMAPSHVLDADFVWNV